MPTLTPSPVTAATRATDVAYATLVLAPSPATAPAAAPVPTVSGPVVGTTLTPLPAVAVTAAPTYLADYALSPGAVATVASAPVPAASGGLRTDRQFTVSNVGRGVLHIGTLTITGSDAFALITDNASGAVLGAAIWDDADPEHPVMLAPGGSTSFSIRFDPTAAGPHTATVLIPTDDPDGTLSLTVTGNGYLTPVPHVTIDPAATYDFGSLYLSDAPSSRAVAFTVTSDGTGPAVVGTVVVSGSGYTKSADLASGQTIPAGESRSFVVTFDPSSTGVKAGTITIPVTGMTSIVVALTGLGVADAGAPPPAPTRIDRFYLTLREPAVLAITDPSTGSRWSSFNDDPDYLLSPTKGGPPNALTGITNHVGASGASGRLYRGITDPLAAQEVDTLFSCYAVAYRSRYLEDRVTAALRFGIWREATDSIDWMTILQFSSPVSPWPDSSTPLPRSFPPPASWRLTASVLDSDRLIVEVGFRAFTIDTNGARMRVGAASGVADLAASQGAQTTTLAPWIEFASGLLVKP